MKRSAGILALGVAVFFGPTCGRKGSLQPPVSRGPQAVRNLSVRQRGAAVVLAWTNPERAIDGRALGPLRAAEVWLLELGAGEVKAPLKLRDFEARARLALKAGRGDWRPAAPGSSGRSPDASIVYPFAGEKFRPRAVAFSVRVLDDQGRLSDFCDPVAVGLRVCPLPPEILDVRVFEDRLEVRWGPPPGNIDGSSPAGVSGYVVYRAEGRGEKDKLTPSPVAGFSYEDRGFSFGVPYAYFVRACAAGTDPCVESDDSEPAEVVPRDTFPPDPPAGLVAVSGTGIVALSWQAGDESDLAGYRVWRKEQGSAPFVPLTPRPIPANAFTDATAEKGKVYVYAVSALDTNGNESTRSESGPVSLKENEP